MKLLIQTCALCLLLNGCDGGSSSAPPPPTPTNLTVQNYDGYTLLQWNQVSEATAYNIYWSTQSGVNTVNGNKVTHKKVSLTHGGLINDQHYYYVVTATNENGESGISSEVQGSPVSELGSGDPLFANQWHLADLASHGTNVQPVWSSCGTGHTCRGEGVRIAVVDDGIEIAHADLLANIAGGISHNYVNDSNDPTPASPSDAHGTAVAGIIAARDYNDTGVRGVAPRANLVGYNLLNNFTLSNEVDAMTRDSANMSVSSNSWGTEDYTGELQDTAASWKAAIDYGLTNGRNGYGTVYVYAAGNGGQPINGSVVDNANYDGYANYRGVMAVAALKNNGTIASYSEPGANILLSAPGGEFCDTTTITTTDRTGSAGFNNAGFYTTTTMQYTDLADDDYTQCMNGTSAATPMVSAAVALMLQANPNLGWRDVRYILATTAMSDPSWPMNGAGYHIHHNYGFGALDIDAAVSKARGWTNLGPMLTVEASSSPGTTIPDNNPTGISNDITISGSGISKIEFVEVTFSAADHTYFADLEIWLTRQGSPTTESILALQHPCIALSGSSYVTVQCTAKYDNWVFGSVRHLDEAADGIWRLTVADKAPQDTGTFQSWKLKIYGH